MYKNVTSGTDYPVSLNKPKTFGASLFYKGVCTYLLGGIVGTVWETLVNFVLGNGFKYCNGSLFTPFNFVYGLGALTIVLCMQRQEKIWKVYLIGFAGGGFVEYFLSFLEEKLLGTRSWNYDSLFLNINGRTTVVYMAVWGLLCVAVVFIIYRPLSRRLDKLPQKPMLAFAVTATVILAFDLLATVCVIMRYVERSAGKEGIVWLAQIIDRYCDDAFMALRFPSMRLR